MLDIRDLHSLQTEITGQLTTIKAAIEDVKTEVRLHRQETLHHLKALQSQKKKSTSLKDMFDFATWVRLGILAVLMISGLGLAESLKLVGPF